MLKDVEHIKVEMDPFLREQLSKLLWSYSYKTIDNSLRELVREFKYNFDQDYAMLTVNNEDTSSTDKVVTVSGGSAAPAPAVESESTSDTKTMTISSEPKKRVLKKPAKVKSGQSA